MLQCPFDHCGKTFTRKANLGGHINAHRGIQPYQCSHCSVKFTRRNEQRVHEREQHSTDHIIQSHQCNGCGVAFPRKTTLVRHQGAGHSSMKCTRTTTKAAIDWTTNRSAPLIVGNTLKTVTMGDVLNDHIPPTDTFYDWTYIAFSTAIDSYKRMDNLAACRALPQPQHQLMLSIAEHYESVIRTTAILFARAPILVVAPALFFLTSLELTRKNFHGGLKLLDIISAASDEKMHKKDLSRFPPEAFCSPRLIQSAESFLLVSDAPAPRDYGSMDDYSFFCNYAIINIILTLFYLWGEQCTDRGLDSQAASVKAVEKGFRSLKRISKPAYIELMSLKDEQRRLESELQESREITDL